MKSSKLKNNPLYFLFILTNLLLFFEIHSSSDTIGSDSAVAAAQAYFEFSGDDNNIANYALMDNGFGFQDAATSCSYRSVFPVAGPVRLGGGTLYLNRNMNFANNGEIFSLGRIDGYGHSLELSQSCTQLISYGTQEGGAALLLVDRTTETNAIVSTDWSPDDNYVAEIFSTNLYIYPFSANSLGTPLTNGIGDTGYSVRWHPTGTTPYYLAVGNSKSNSELTIYTFTTPSTITSASNNLNAPVNAVAWIPAGTSLAIARTNSNIDVYAFTGGALGVQQATVATTQPVSQNALVWAPAATGDYLAAGTATDGGAGYELTIYYFDGSSLTTTAAVNLNQTVETVDWSPNGSYLAVGCSTGGNNRLKIYKYDKNRGANGGFAYLEEAYHTNEATGVLSVGWSPTGNNLIVGLETSSETEFRLYSFDINSTTSLSLVLEIQAGNNVTTNHFSNDGIYIARGDESNFLSIYRPVTTLSSGIVNTHIFLNNNLEIKSPLTFEGDCSIDARNHKITFVDDGSIGVKPNSTINIKLASLQFNNPAAFALEARTSKINFQNSIIELESNLVFGDGALEITDDLVITGPHSFEYESLYTSTINSFSNLKLEDGATLKLGQNASVSQQPIEFTNSTSKLILDNSRLNVENLGLIITKGTIDIFNSSTFFINPSDPNYGLTIGDGIRANDPILNIKPGSQLKLSNGNLFVNTYSSDTINYVNPSAELTLDSNSTLNLQRSINLQNGIFEPNNINSINVYGNSYLTANNIDFKCGCFGEEFLLTGTLNNVGHITLDQNDNIRMIHGNLSKTITVSRNNNSIEGTGEVAEEITLIDENSILNWAINSKNQSNINLNNGSIIYNQDSGFFDDKTFTNSGRINLTNKVFEFGNQETNLTNTIYWQGDHSTIRLNNNLDLSGTYTFRGYHTIDGHNNILDLGTYGQIIVQGNSTLNFENITIKNLKANNIQCTDDDGTIIFKDSTIFITQDFTYNKGTIQNSGNSTIFLQADLILNNNSRTHIDGNVIISGNHNITYDSTRTSTISAFSNLELQDEAKLITGKSPLVSQHPLEFEDNTSKLTLNNSTLNVNSNGLQLTKGELRIKGISYLEMDSTTSSNGLIFGDGTLGNDHIIKIDAGSTMQMSYGIMTLNNLDRDSIVFLDNTGKVNYGDGNNLIIFNIAKSQKLSKGAFLLAADNILLSIDPSEYLTFNKLNVLRSTLEYEITGTVSAIFNVILDKDDFIIVKNGTFTPNITVSQDGNQIMGTGKFEGNLTFIDNNSTLNWDLEAKSKQNINLNNGNLYYNTDSGLIDDSTITGSGQIILDNNVFKTGNIESNWTSTIYWQGNNSTVELSKNLDLSGSWTFRGNHTINGQNHTLDLGTHGEIIVEGDSTLTLKNLKINNLKSNNIRCTNDNGTVIIEDSTLLITQEFDYYKGKIVNSGNTTILLQADLSINNNTNLYIDGNLIISGEHTINYDSTKTSTIASFSSLELQNKAILRIGKHASFSQQPLELESNTSKLMFNGSTLSVNSNGMQLTKGELLFKGSSAGTSYIEIDSTNPANGLIFGDGTLTNDLTLKMEAGSSMQFSYGVITINNKNRNSIVFLDNTSKIIFGDGNNLALLNLEKHLTVSDGIFALANDNILITKATPAYFTMNNVDVIRSNLEYNLTGTISSLLNLVLNQDDSIIVKNGKFFQNVTIEKSGNQIIGSGKFEGNLNLTDENSVVNWDLNSKSENDISLNNGNIYFDIDSGLAGDSTLTGSGQVIFNSNTFKTGNIESNWTSTVYWQGNHSTIELGNNLDLSGSWTFRGHHVINGKTNELYLGRYGQITIEGDSTLELQNITIHNLKDTNIKCTDNSGKIVLKNTNLHLQNSIYFNKGALKIEGLACIIASGSTTGHNFYYNSSQTSTIDHGSTLEINDYVNLELGKTNAKSNIQPLEFAEFNSVLHLNGGTLSITSSGMQLEKGTLLTSKTSTIDIEPSQFDNSLIIGSGSANNNFVLEINGNTKLIIDRGRLVYNNYDPSNGIIFNNNSSTLFINNPGNLSLQKDLTISNGTIEYNIENDAISFFNKSTLRANNINKIQDEPFSICRVNSSQTEENINLLNNNNYFIGSAGKLQDRVKVLGRGNRIEGQVLFKNTDSVYLENENSELIFAIQSKLNSDIELRNGTMKIDSDLHLADDRNITGSGDIFLQGNSLYFGGTDLNLTHTIFWCDANDVNLTGKTNLSGKWTFNGVSTLNGHGNTLDITNGGTLYVNNNATLHLTNLTIKGLGIDKGWLEFATNSSKIIMSDVKIEMENRFTTSIGGIYVDSPSTVIVKNYNWNFDNYASLTVDGITLWKNSTNNDTSTRGDIIIDSTNLTELAQGTIDYIASDSQIKNNSNTIELHDQYFETIDHGYKYLGNRRYENLGTGNSKDLEIHQIGTIYRLNSDIYLSNDHTLTLPTEVTQIDGNGHVINFARENSNGTLIIPPSATVTTTNVVLRGFKADNISKSLNSSFSFNEGTTIELFESQDLDQTWSFAGNTILNGFGNNLTLNNNNNRINIVGEDSRLTIQNLNIGNVRFNNIRIDRKSGALTLRNTELILDNNYNFTIGTILFEQGVTIRGTNAFVYESSYGSTIASNSTIFLDQNTTLSYAPTRAESNLLIMIDASSALSLNGATLQVTTTGLKLTRGTLILDHKNYLYNQDDTGAATSISEAITFGDGNDAENDLNIEILPGGSVDLKSGILDFNNINA